MPLPADHDERMVRARLALDGLSVGDAFGERFFTNPQTVEGLIASRAVPRSPWPWTDDTAMALSVVDVLGAHGGIDRDALAEAFAGRYAADPHRGYGGGAHGILRAIGSGVPWTVAAGAVFGGEGSMGNGGAMRVAPVGAYFADDLDHAAEHARASAEPTHQHPDGQAGAMAIAVGTATAWQMKHGGRARDSEAFLRTCFEHTPEGPTAEGIAKVMQLPLDADVRTVVSAVGSGSRVISWDTVPFCLWAAARHLDDPWVEAMWTTVAGLGDRDTTCAIVGGMLAAAAGADAIPAEWLSAREPL